MDFENAKENKEFKPSWGLILSYCAGITFGHTAVALVASDINIKPEINISLINEIIDRLCKKYNYKDVVILNIQIVWVNEYLK